MTRFPKINLAIDNCFAAKRWTAPAEWMSVISDLGLTHIEASADNECDPLYHGIDYLHRWIEAVLAASERTGCRVANLYSGHGTYATLGLAHTEKAVRDRFLNQWMKPMVDVADALSAGLGFFAHAFPLSVLSDPDRYAAAETDLIDRLAEIAAYAAGKRSVGPVGIEQMYSPHQIPWTIKGTRRFISDIFARKGAPFYLTLDVGHQSGQRKFLRPTKAQVSAALSERDAGKLWLGTERAYSTFKNAGSAKVIMSEIEAHPYLFAEESDGDPYRWLEEFAGWSPIVHLQQTDGTSSSHWAFTADLNRRGIIDPKRVLESIHTHYVHAGEPGDSADMPPRVETITLTLEMFSATADHPHAIVSRLGETVDYWRQFIPQDGLTVDQLVKPLDSQSRAE